MCPFLPSSPVTQSYICCLSRPIFHHGLCQEPGQGSLCYTAGPHCWSILSVGVCMYYLQTPSPSRSLLPPPLATTSPFLICVSTYKEYKYLQKCDKCCNRLYIYLSSIYARCWGRQQFLSYLLNNLVLLNPLHYTKLFSKSLGGKAKKEGLCSLPG